MAKNSETNITESSLLEDLIIFQDDYFAVLYKSVGENSQNFFKNLFPEKKYVQVVNRLDQPVSGLLIIAFSPKIHEKFNKLFRSRQVKKEYWAICKKRDNLKIAEVYHLEDYLIFNTKKQKAFIVSESEENKSKKSKEAKLDFILAGSGENYSFLRVFPLTGRTHQIRAQLANYAMPIKGDIKYGFKRTEKGGGIRLHSYAVEFPHPISGDLMKFSCPPKQSDNLWNACIQVCLSSQSEMEARE